MPDFVASIDHKIATLKNMQRIEKRVIHVFEIVVHKNMNDDEFISAAISHTFGFWIVGRVTLT